MHYRKQQASLLCLIACLAFLAGGCAKEEGNSTQASGKTTPSSEKGKAHDHSGWWCDEHGVREAICGQCNPKVAAECKKNGDWCKQHDRPDSQCLVCHPELEEKFAAQYEAKYGKKPPKPDKD